MSTRPASMEDRLVGLSADKKELLNLLMREKSRGVQRITPYAREVDEGEIRAPTSWAQQRLWFIDKLEGGSGAYHITVALRMHGNLQVDALRGALDELVRRHEVLRTSFQTIGDEPWQVIAPAAHFSLSVVDLTGTDEENREQQLRLHKIEEAYAPFDLSTGPLIRGRLLHVSLGQHLLLITMHHIVADGWSMGVFMRELAALYDALRRGRPEVLPQLPIQYADYAQWQREWTSGNRMGKQLNYWRENLEGAVPHLELPTDKPRAKVQSYRGKKFEFTLNAQVSAALRNLAQSHQLTLFMVLYVGWAVLLSRLSRQSDILIGTPVANRRRPELEGLIGFFVNTLVLRMSVAPAMPLRALLSQAKEVTLNAYEHQDVPFEHIVEALQPERTLGLNPLFQVMLALQNAPMTELRMSELTIELDDDVYSASKFDLLLSLEERGEVIAGRLSYSTELFEPQTMGRWIGCFTELLHAMPQHLDTPVGELPWLSENEHLQVLRIFNSTQVTYDSRATVHQLFEQQACSTPNATAVMYKGQSVTYGELNARANQMAHYLRSLGVGPDRRVGICVERSIEMVIAVLGTLKAGGAYVPLDPNYPTERLAYMIEDAVPEVVLVQRRLSSALPSASSRTIQIDAQWHDIEKHASENLPVVMSSMHLVYVIYTSGSTGQPKGTAMPHGSMVNLLEWHRATLPCAQDERVLQFAALSFDVCFQEIFSTLCLGGTLVLLNEWVRRDAAALVRMLDADQITRLFLPPLMLQSIAEICSASGSAPKSLRDVVTAGEQLRISSHIAELFERMPTCRLHNHYGPTESHVVTSLTMPRDAPKWPALPTIGQPIANTQIYILDSHRQPVCTGVVGEIHIAGSCLARGYLHRENLTNERFMRDSFSADPQARMYKTGDLARWRADGTIEYIGRNDDQVKIRGFRIEVGEVEARVAEHAQVSKVAVVARKDALGGSRLVAYVVPHDPSFNDVEALRAHVQAALPEYMTPSAFVMLETLPVTPTGKLDRRKLPEPRLEALITQKYEPPVGNIETLLSEIWRQLLNVERVGRQDNFFELGGHSLLVVRMLERLRRAGVAADVRSIYLSPTLADAARALSRIELPSLDVPPNLIPAACDVITPQMLPLVTLTLEQIERIALSVPEGTANIQDIYPLAPLQEGILFHHLLDENGIDAYARPILFSVSSQETLKNFIRGLQRIVDRHDVLRTAVIWEYLPQPVQVVQRRATLPVRYLELDDTQPVVEQLRERMRSHHRRLDLQQAPLIRLEIAGDRASGSWYALLLTHHILFDQLSLQMLIDEILRSVDGRVESTTAPVPYRNHVAHALRLAKERDAEAFFRRKLGDVDEPTAPLGLPEVHSDASQSVGARRILSVELSQRIHNQARQHGTSAATLFHSAWALVLAKLAGRADVVFGSVLLGRMHGDADTRCTLGMFMNTLPLRVRLEKMTAEHLIKQTQTELAELLGYEQTPLAVAQRCSAINGATPLFSTLVNYLHTGGEFEAGVASAAGVTLIAGEGGTNYPIMLSIDDHGAQFMLNAQTEPRIDPERIVGYAAAAVSSLVTALEQSAQTPALRLSILPDDERRQVIELFNATQAPFASSATLHQLIEEQVRRSPGAVALAFEGQTLSYETLNARANQIAHYLRAAGVGPDQLVGICAERSLEMVIGLLGILKAGGAYVPLDPHYPAERLAFMVEDTAPKLLLIQSGLRDRLPATNARLVALDDWDTFERQPTTNIDPRVVNLTPEHLAYMIYTSGSTGRPKGAMNEHRGIVNRLQWMQSEYRLQPHDRVLQKTPFSFDVSVWEFFWPLMTGAALIIARPQGHQDPHYLYELVEESGATTLHFVPSMLQVFLEQHAVGRCPTLRHIVCSGEELTPALQNRCLQQFPNVRLSNLYGPTEAAVDVTFWECEAPEHGKRVPIGRPISNIQIYVLDEQRGPVPIGVVGEIYIGGVGVGRGYLNRPELTADRFVEDPFGSEARARLYKTGDVGCWRSDGVVEYMGRNDHQVKLRGFRIELGEIESVLTRQPGVKDALVVAREDVAGEKRLVAYVMVVDPNEPPTDEDMRGALKAVLPEYMVPSAFVVLQAWPLTPNGKLDRKALPTPNLAARAGQEYEAPEGELEQTLADIWRELLRVDAVARNANFFELGGHSLHGVKLISRVAERFGVRLPVVAVFAHPTVRLMAQALWERLAMQAEQQSVEMEEGSI